MVGNQKGARRSWLNFELGQQRARPFEATVIEDSSWSLYLPIIELDVHFADVCYLGRVAPHAGHMAELQSI